MKQLISIISLLFFVHLAVAQRTFVASKQINASSTKNLKIAGIKDTLGIKAFRAAQKVLYRDQLNGYAVGTNYFNDQAKAQQFDTTILLNVSKVLFYFGAKKKVAPDSISFLLVNIYSLQDAGFTTSGGGKLCPGNVLYSQKLLLDSIDTIPGHFTAVNFDWAPTTSDTSLANALKKFKFAIGFDMTHLDTADRVGLYSTKDSSVNISQYSWEKQSNGNWYSMKSSWPLDIDLAIFPIVANDTNMYISTNDLQKTKELSLQAYPNPANNYVNINFSLSKASPVTLTFYDADGKLITRNKFENLLNGTQKVEQSTLDFRSGVYSYTLQTNESCQSKKLIVIH